MIDMHVYLPDKYRPPISSWCLSFLKSWSVGSKLRWLFHSCILESHLVILTSGKGLMPSYFYVLHLLSQGLPILPDIFLKRESWSQPYHVFFLLPPSLIMPPKCSNWVYFGVSICESKFGFFVQRNVFIQNFRTSKLFQPQKSFWH
jgi:hypothetical protein